MVEVSSAGNDSYDEVCAEIGYSLFPNRSVVMVPCQPPVLARQLRLHRYGGPEQSTMNLCEVFIHGYLYQG